MVTIASEQDWMDSILNLKRELLEKERENRKLKRENMGVNDEMKEMEDRIRSQFKSRKYEE